VKVLYAIQGTGNGHIARAEDIVPALQKHVEVDILISGTQSDIFLPFDVKFKSQGLSFYFGKNGGVDLIKTIKKNRSKNVFSEIRNFPIEQYDLVINDFEPISAWAAHLKKIPCIGLSHQGALRSSKVPRPKHYDPVGDWILRRYAPCDEHVGFHFKNFDHNIFTPVIRSSIRTAVSENRGHYTVYLPAYDDKKLLPLLSSFEKVEWHVFSKHTHRAYGLGRISVYPIDNQLFKSSMASSKGVLCGAGFETPAEALYLNKKLLVVPMKKQYEQHYNAAALSELGVPVIKKMKKKYKDQLAAWLECDQKISVDYQDIAEDAVLKALSLKTI
jgi:uncharacterized protein (TIGR00661 family)